MKPDEVEEQKALFNTDPRCRIILLQAEASKYGHTLLGGPAEEDKCRTMVFFENSYSADTRDQVEDRIHRRGQTGEYVLYIDLSGSDLDRRIVKALQRKDALYRSVFKNLKSAPPMFEDYIVPEPACITAARTWTRHRRSPAVARHKRATSRSASIAVTSVMA